MKTPFKSEHWRLDYLIPDDPGGASYVDGATQLEKDPDTQTVTYYDDENNVIWSRAFTAGEIASNPTASQLSDADTALATKEANLEKLAPGGATIDSLEATRDELRDFVSGASSLTLTEMFGAVQTALQDVSDNPEAIGLAVTMSQIHSRSIEYLFGVAQAQQAAIADLTARVTALETA